jgi:hypothetical protein
MVAAWLCCGEIDFGLSICDFFFLFCLALKAGAFCGFCGG